MVELEGKALWLASGPFIGLINALFQNQKLSKRFMHQHQAQSTTKTTAWNPLLKKKSTRLKRKNWKKFINRTQPKLL